MFYFILGFAVDAAKFFLFFTFVFLGLCTFTFLGQMLVSLFRDSQTAQGFGGLIVSFSSLFSGILIRPGMWFDSLHYLLFANIFLIYSLLIQNTIFVFAVWSELIPVRNPLRWLRCRWSCGFVEEMQNLWLFTHKDVLAIFRIDLLGVHVSSTLRIKFTLLKD